MGLVSDKGRLLLSFTAHTWDGRHVRCREYLRRRDTPENRKLAVKLLEQIRAEILTGTFDYLARFPDGPKRHLFTPPADPRDLTFAAFAERWIQRRCPIREDGTIIPRHAIHPTTWYNERLGVKLRLIPRFGAKRLSEITRSDVLEWSRELLDHGGRGGKGLGVKTVHNASGTLRKMLNDAQDEGLIERNPVPRTSRSERRALVYRGNQDPLTTDEVTRFLGAVPRRYHALYRLWFSTGMRPSEIVALQWPDVDWSRGMLLVRRGRTPRLGGREAAPKTGVRIVTLAHDPEAMAVLRAHHDQRRSDAKPSPYVFATSVGTPFSQEELNRAVWHKTLEKLEIRPRGQYAIKDTFVSLAMSLGEELGWIAQQTGTSEATLLRHYRAYLPNQTRQDGSLIGRTLGAILGGSLAGPHGGSLADVIAPALGAPSPTPALGVPVGTNPSADRGVDSTPAACVQRQIVAEDGQNLEAEGGKSVVARMSPTGFEPLTQVNSGIPREENPSKHVPPHTSVSPKERRSLSENWQNAAPNISVDTTERGGGGGDGGEDDRD